MPRAAPFLVASAVAAALGGCGVAGGPRGSAGPPMEAPRFSAAGELLRPDGFRTWVFVGASLGLSYAEEGVGPERFHNVFMQPAAYEHYAATGTLPEGTTLVLALHEPRRQESISREGSFEGDLVSLAAAVKDSDRFEGGWGYFDFGERGTKGAAEVLPRSRCADCHAAHGAVDNVFVQFYPALRDLGKRVELAP